MSERVVQLEAEPEPRPAASVPSRDKPIAMTGAAGFVGTQLCRELARRGWTVRGLVRDSAKASERLAGLPVELVAGDVRDVNALRQLVRGAAGVIHLAAIAIERRGDTYESINTDATLRLIDAMRHEGVERLVHMSQNGASSALPYRFLRSKGIAQDAVVASGLEWTVLRPSVIFGQEDEFVNVLARLVRISPLVFPLPGGGKARFQPIAVGDVARAAAMSLDRADAIEKTFALGGPVPLTLKQMAERILVAMHANRAIIPLPVPALRPVIAVMQRVLPSPPVTTSLLDLLAIDNTIPDNALTEFFGLVPVPFAPEEIMYLRRITFRDALRRFLG